MACNLEQRKCVDQGSEKGSRQNSGREKEQEINEGQKGRACVHMKHLAHPKGARVIPRFQAVGNSKDFARHKAASIEVR